MSGCYTVSGGISKNISHSWLLFADLPMQQNNSNTHLRFQGYQGLLALSDFFPSLILSSLSFMNQGRPSHSHLCCMSSTERRGKTGKDRVAAVSFRLLLTDAWWRWCPREGHFWHGGVHMLPWPLDQNVNKQSFVAHNSHVVIMIADFSSVLIRLPFPIV